RHPLDELLVRSDHAVQPPAVILAPDVERVEGIALAVARWLADEPRRATRPGQRGDSAVAPARGERLGVAGAGPEARAPEQARRVPRREPAAQDGQRGGGQAQ